MTLAARQGDRRLRREARCRDPCYACGVYGLAGLCRRVSGSAALHERDDFDGVAVMQHDFAALVAWHDIAVEFDGHALGAKPALFDELRDADRRVERFLLSVDDHDDPSRWCCSSVAARRLGRESVRRPVSGVEGNKKRVSEEIVPIGRCAPS